MQHPWDNSTIFYQQDKENATERIFGLWKKRETRFSFCRKNSKKSENRRDMRGERNTDRSVRKFITIRDTELWEKIDKIMEEPKYAKSFNKVINDALYYGLDELMRHLFEPEETVEEEQERVLEKKLLRRAGGVNETYFMDIERQLKEVILNVTINKSLLSSLFNAKARELERKSVSGGKFTDGRYSETPEYLSIYELAGIRDLRS